MKSIRFKLWSGMMSLVVIVLVLLWLFQIVFLESFYTNTRIKDVKNEGFSIIKIYNEADTKNFKNKLDAFAFKNNMSAEMLDLGGNSIYTAGSVGQMPMMINNSRIEVYDKALSGKVTTAFVTHPRFGNKFIIIGLPIETEGKIGGVLIINMPLAPVEDTTSILKRQLFYITIVLLIAASAISLLISKSFTHPILEIKKASEIMASGDFSVRIEAKKQDEIGALAETINYLGNQLSKIDKLRKDFIANVSHELRTPLSLIRGYAETLRDVTGGNPEKREKQLGIIIDETERLSRLVDDILNLSQIQSGNFSIDKGKFSIKSTLNRVISRYDVLSEKTGIKLVLTNCSDVILEADEGRMEQVFYNLINNAFNHTLCGGVVNLRAIEGDRYIRFEVSDTGSGISKEDIPHIWDRYYKAEKTSEKKAVGTGLGLVIVKGVLEAHKAKFGVESKINEGSTFWFEIEII